MEKYDTVIQAFMETTTQPFLVIDGDFRVECANSAFCETFNVSAGEAADSPLFQLADGQWEIPQLHELVENAAWQDQAVDPCRIEHDFDTIGPRTLLMNVRKLADDGEHADKILLAIDDVTEREQTEELLVSRAEFADKLIDSIDEMVLVLTADFAVAQANAAFYSQFGVTPDETLGESVFAIADGQWDNAQLRRLLSDILPEGSSFDDFEIDCEFENIGDCVMRLNARRLDHSQLILLAIHDITAQRQEARRQSELLGEMQHRQKNLLANIISLVQLSSQNANSVAGYVNALRERLFSLARTKDLLLRSSDETVDLGARIRSELAALGAEDGKDFSVAGPALTLTSQEAQIFGMAIHELGTNAIKYGALKSQPGHVSIHWMATPDNEGSGIEFVWREAGLATRPVEPSSQGFGSLILEKNVPYMLNGRAALNFHPDGVEFRLTFTPGLAASADRRTPKS